MVWTGIVCSSCHFLNIITRSKYENYRIWQDAFMVALRRAKWTHEFNTKMNLRNVFWQFYGMPKIFQTHSKMLQQPVKVNCQTIAQDALTNGPLVYRSYPNLNIFYIVCPSGVNFGTVWRLHWEVNYKHDDNTKPFRAPFACLGNLYHSGHFWIESWKSNTGLCTSFYRLSVRKTKRILPYWLP